MGENVEPLAVEASEVPAISHRRILYLMGVVVLAGTAAGFGFFSVKAGFGVLLGGVLSYANYFWQRHSIEAIFDKAVRGGKPRFLALRYVLRYVVIGSLLALIYFSQTVSIFAVIFGLASFAIAVVIEGLVSISGFRRES